jgi:Na+-translocating ferredoxin:NAD+ oxidoreductase RNF subunit RnfB
MARPLWFVNLLKKYFPDRFRIAQATKWPIIGPLMDLVMFRHDDTIYLPKDHVITINHTLQPPQDVVLPSQVAEYFVRQASHHWLMETCFCRDANDCVDYPVDMGCLFLGEAVQKMDRRLGKRIDQETALAHLQRCREAGLVHMIGRNRIDVVWTGASPGHKLLTICSCCPCCCLWRVTPHLNPNGSANVSKMPGVSIHVTERCIGCGDCADDTCFVDAIRLVNDRAQIATACKACGVCVETCPQQAIEIRVDDKQFVDKTIARLSKSVDVT